MARARCLKLTVLALVCGSFAASGAHATLYTFINIADNTTAAPTSVFDDFSVEPSISGSIVAFTGTYDSASAQGVFTGSGGSLTTIAKTGDLAPSGQFDDFGNPAISGSTVAFKADFNGSSDGVFIVSSGVLTTIAKTGDPAPSGTFDELDRPALSGSTVAFNGQYGTDQGVFTGSGGPLTTITKTGDAAPTGSFDDVGDPAIDGGTVAFTGEFNGSNQGVFSGSGGTPTTVAQTGDPAPTDNFVLFDNPSISGNTLAFEGVFDGDTSGIFTGSGGALTTIAVEGDPAPSGMFDGFDDPAISGSTVAFVGFWDDGDEQSGIFTGSGGSLETVIKTGDSLFGSIVESLDFGRFGLDPDGSGNLAFSYNLADGRYGIAMASPTAVPEARAWLALGAVSVGSIASLLIRRRTSDARQYALDVGETKTSSLCS